jgi:hypothetical protein
MEFLLAKALDHLEPGTAGLAAVDFDRAGDQHLADPAAAGGQHDRIVFGAERDDRLVGLDQPAERLARGVDHGAAQLGAQQPSSAVRAECELVLQLQRRDAVGMRRHQKRRSKRYSAHAPSVAKRPWNSINDRGNRRSDPQTRHSPCSFDANEQQLTPAFPFCTLNLDRPDARA